MFKAINEQVYYIFYIILSVIMLWIWILLHRDIWIFKFFIILKSNFQIFKNLHLLI